MTDDERDMDIESEDDDMDDDELNDKGAASASTKPMTQAEKRAHHNALERKRRDHIKDSFTSLRDSVPSLHGEKQSSRAQILKKAAEYIQFMRRKNSAHQHDIEDLKRQNNILENQSKSIRAIERARLSGNLRSATVTMAGESLHEVKHEENDEEDDLHATDSIPNASATTAIPVASGTKKIKILTLGAHSK